MRIATAQTTNSENTRTRLNSILPHLLNNQLISLSFTLFNDGSNISHYINSDGSMIVNDELERKWTKAFLSEFEVLSQHVPREIEEIPEKTQ
jgi:hypothetical protein